MDTPGPEYIAPFIVYLASDKGARISGSTFMLMGNMIGLYSEPALEKQLIKKSKEVWGIDELIEKVESELLPGYKSIVD
jgi:hypothetical protein